MLGREVYRVELSGLRLQLLDLVLVVGDLLLDALEVPLADSAQTFSAAHAGRGSRLRCASVVPVGALRSTDSLLGC